MAFCASCGSQVDGRFCPKCGAPAGGGAVGGGMNPGPTPAPMASSAGMTDNMAGALCYVFGLITGILFLVLAPYNQNRNIRFHAFQSIFWHLGLIVLWIVLAIVAIALHVIPVLGALLSAVLYFVLGIGGFISWLYLMFKTYNGDKVVLPVVGPIAEKQAGA
ncbi:MAG TPA: hypothetical protein VMH80_26210 [Bryobacteraceae bacterium]|nr:hypothetical protein [Bryobacteraceae bacterium]